MNPFVIIGGPKGERAERGTIPARSPMLAARHSRHAGRSNRFAIFGDGSFARVQRYGGCRRTTGHRTALKFIPTIRDVGSLIPGLRRALQACKQSRNGVGQYLHVVSSLLPVISNDDRRIGQGVGKRPQEFVKQGQGNE